jgi:hypothetical protein
MPMFRHKPSIPQLLIGGIVIIITEGTTRDSEFFPFVDDMDIPDLTIRKMI